MTPPAPTDPLPAEEARPLDGVTIDASTTRDMDDAVWVDRCPDGWQVTVCVADASSAVPIGSSEDDRARAMGATHYFSTGNSPMLPRLLSENLLSLRAGRRRPVLAIRVALSRALDVTDTALSRATFTSRDRLAYETIPEILRAAEHPLHPMLTAASELSLALCAHRRAAGAFAFYDLHQGWLTTEEGTIRKLVDVRATIGHLIVQELMILANATLATWAAVREVPILYRNHTARLTEVDRAALARELTDARVLPEGRVEALRRRTNLLLDRATYNPSLRGHFGLALPAYVHATSPLRRYADLVNHRQILAALDGTDPPHTLEDLAALGEHLTALTAAERDRTAALHKGNAEARAADAVNHRRLDGLDAAGFERATKMAVRAGTDPPEEFVEGFVRRTCEGRSPVLALTVVVIETPRTSAWAPIADAVVAALAIRPADAMALLSQARSIAAWETPALEVDACGPPHGRRFTARMTLRGATTEATAAARKVAEQLAAVRLIAALLDRPCPALPEAPPIAPAPDVVATTPHAEGQDPIARLYERAQSRKAAPPTFRVATEGPSHQPTFLATVSSEGQEATGQGPTKQLARRTASAALLRRLQA